MAALDARDGRLAGARRSDRRSLVSFGPSADVVHSGAAVTRSCVTPSHPLSELRAPRGAEPDRVLQSERIGNGKEHDLRLVR